MECRVYTTTNLFSTSVILLPIGGDERYLLMGVGFSKHCVKRSVRVLCIIWTSIECNLLSNSVSS